MPGAHSPRGPSGAHRWRKCARSVIEEEGLPDEAGMEAAYGTVFHEYAALCLEVGLDPHVFVGAPCDTDKGTLYFDRQMAENMLTGLDYVRDTAAEPGSELFVETQVDLSPWLGPDEFGTADVGIINVPKRKIVGFDWKYGAGEPVDPKWNDQVILYLLGFWHTVAAARFEGVDPAEIEVTINIEQPRAPGGGGVWYTNMAVLLREGEQIRKDADKTRDPNAVATPGTKQCKFCKAAKANTCKARAEAALDMFDAKLDDVDEYAEIGATLPLPKPKALTPEQRTYILLNADLITGWLKALHAEAYDDAMKGRPVPDMKLVYGRNPARAWRDADKAKPTLERAFGDDAYTRKLLSPSQVEEKVGKKEYKARFDKHVNYGDPKPELVPLTDRRDPIPNLQAKFDALMGEDDLV